MQMFLLRHNYMLDRFYLTLKGGEVGGNVPIIKAKPTLIIFFAQRNKRKQCVALGVIVIVGGVAVVIVGMLYVYTGHYIYVLSAEVFSTCVWLPMSPMFLVFLLQRMTTLTSIEILSKVK